jgi:N-acetylneuraminate synthase
METISELLSKRVLIIAEIGCNHNGDMNIAKQLIEVAASAGADCAKFQSFNPDELMVRHAPKASYQIEATSASETQYERLCRLRLSKDDHLELKKHCEEQGVLFCSSPFDHGSADLLFEVGVPFVKIASGEVTNLPFLAYIGSLDLPIVMSTGMASIEEIEEALDTIEKDNSQAVVLMHCLSSYPAPWEEANLLAIKALQETFSLPVGFSDHSEGIDLSLAAVALGAVAIEKHITLDKDMEGGDHRASLEPHEFEELVKKIRKLEVALGDGVKRCMPSEENIRDVARKSIVSLKSINEGQVIASADIGIKRPGTGIPPRFVNRIIGSRAKEDISEDRLIKWNQIDL